MNVTYQTAGQFAEKKYDRTQHVPVATIYQELSRFTYRLFHSESCCALVRNYHQTPDEGYEGPSHSHGGERRVNECQTKCQTWTSQKTEKGLEGAPLA